MMLIMYSRTNFNVFRKYYTYGDGWMNDMWRVRHGWSVPWQWDHAKARLGHQFMVGPGSGEPMARQNRAGESWRPVLLLHNWNRVRGALGDDMGSWPYGQHGVSPGVTAWLLRLGRDLSTYMSLYSWHTMSTCFTTLNQRFLSVSF